MRKPYFRKDRGCWFVKTSDGKSQVNLGPDEAAAYERWREIQQASAAHASSPCVVIVQEFLLHAKQAFSHSAFSR